MAAFLLSASADLVAAELVMFRTAGCPWCAAWDRDIGPIYGRTEIGRRVPVRHVDFAQRPAYQAALAQPVRYSPTFVLLHDGRELGRIEGYPGEEFFWARLEGLMLESSSQQAISRTSPGDGK